MDLYLLNIIGSVCIGVYTLVTDKIIIVPKYVSLSKAKKLSELLKVRLIHSTVGDSVLAGALSCANSNGILLPHFVGDKEIKAIKPFFKGNITIMEAKKTAYGNLVLANDLGAVVDPSFTSSEIKKISDTLGVDVVPGKIANLPYVGSLAVATIGTFASLSIFIKVAIPPRSSLPETPSTSSIRIIFFGCIPE